MINIKYGIEGNHDVSFEDGNKNSKENIPEYD